MAAFSGRRILRVWDGDRLSFGPCIGGTSLELGGKEGRLRHSSMVSGTETVSEAGVVRGDYRERRWQRTGLWTCLSRGTNGSEGALQCICKGLGVLADRKLHIN